MRSTLIARAGLASAPVTAFAPLIGATLTGYGTPWLALPIGSVAAFACGTRASRRTAAERRCGVIVSAPAAVETGIEYATAPRDEITVEFAWSDEAA